jgi:hypothetical protein
MSHGFHAVSAGMRSAFRVFRCFGERVIIRNRLFTAARLHAWHIVFSGCGVTPVSLEIALSLTYGLGNRHRSDVIDFTMNLATA